MEILVCVKQVPDDSVEIYLDSTGKKPNLSDVTMTANAFDTYALEMAVRFKEANGGNVSVLTVDSEDAKNTLKNCIAVGASKAYFANDTAFANADQGVAVAILTAAIKKIEADNGTTFDMVLCGKESSDEITAQVGPMLAEKLGIGFVNSVVAVNTCEAGLSVKQETDSGYNIVETASPAVIAVSKPDYDPRYPSIKSKMASRKAVIQEIKASDIGEIPAAKLCLLEYENPPKKQAGIKIQEKEPAEAVAKAMAQMIQDKAL